VASVKKWIEEKRVIQFLRGLNSEFEARRSTIFHQSNLPSLENAPPPSRPIFAATKFRDDRECFNCGDTRHLIRECPKPLKANRGRGRGGSRGAPRGRGRGGRGG
jgi:hypothetical protein